MFYTNFDCYHLNQAQTRPGPEQAQDRPSGRIGPVFKH
jgi:hypothetical protein